MTVRSIRRLLTLLVLLVVVGGAALWIHSLDSGSEPAFRKACGTGAGVVVDEAKCAGLSEKDLHVADDDYFADMDNGATKNPDNVAKDLAPYVPGISPQEAVRRVVIGRNNWIVWTAGNDRFWDVLATKRFGRRRPVEDDLECTQSEIQPRQSLELSWSGQRAMLHQADSAAHGPLRTMARPARSRTARADPFENETKYPGVKIGARGTNSATERRGRLGSYYGYATGVVGLRLFPNPDFDDEARKQLGRGTATTPTRLLQQQEAGAPLPGRHVLRLLSRRAQSDQPAGGPRNTPSGKISTPIQARSISGSIASSTSTATDDLPLPVVPHLAPGIARYVARVVATTSTIPAR